MDNGQDIHFIITGGESLLGWQRFYVELFEHPKNARLKKRNIPKQIQHNHCTKIPRVFA